MSEPQTQSRLRSGPARSHAHVVAQAPIVLVLTADEALAKLVRGAGSLPWKVEHFQSAHNRVDLLARPNLKLVVLDDGVVEDNERGWLLSQIRLRAPGASLMYVASNHDVANERRARASGAHYYTSKPLDEHRFVQVLQSFLKLHRHK